MFDGLLLDQTDILVPFGDSVSSVTVLPASFLAAVHADWQTAGLDASVGTLWAYVLGRGKSLKDGNYVIVDFGSSAPALISGRGQIDATQVNFTCYATTAEDANAMAQTVDAWIMADDPVGRQFAWSSGYGSPLTRASWAPGVGWDLTPDGRLAYHTQLPYRLKVRGQR